MTKINIMKPEIQIKNAEALQAREQQIIKALIAAYFELKAEQQLFRSQSDPGASEAEVFAKVWDNALNETTQFIGKHFDGLDVEIDMFGGDHSQT